MRSAFDRPVLSDAQLVAREREEKIRSAAEKLYRRLFGRDIEHVEHVERVSETIHPAWRH